MGGLRLFFVSSLALVSVMLNVPSSKAEAAQTVIFSKKVVRQTERFPEGRPFTFIELIQKPGLHSSMEECSKKAHAEYQSLKASYDGKFWTDGNFPLDFSIWSVDSSIVLSCTTIQK